MKTEKILPSRVKVIFWLFVVLGVMFSIAILYLFISKLNWSLLVTALIALIGYYGGLIYAWFNVYSDYKANWISEQIRINTKDFNQMNELTMSLNYYQNEIERHQTDNRSCFNEKNSKDSFQDLVCQQVRERIEILSERKQQITDTYDNFLLKKETKSNEKLMEKLHFLKSKKEKLLQQKLDELNNSKVWINLDVLENEIFKKELIKRAKGEGHNSRLTNSRLTFFLNPFLKKLVYIFWENDSLNKSLHRKKIQNLLKNSDNKEIKNWFAINHNKQLEKKNNNSSYLLFQTNYLTKKSNYFLMENEQNNSGILKVNLENQKVKNFISSLNYKTEYKLKEKIFTQKINEVYNEGKDSGLTWNESIK